MPDDGRRYPKGSAGGGAACMALLQIQLHRATCAPHPLATHAQAATNTPKVQPVVLSSDPCTKYLTVFPTGTCVLGSLACWVHQLHRIVALLDDDLD
ncbi:hypothetical protein FOA52_014102 [Chlamydomonas sp. UWO 241]|nr:hypothetical protein FOA52_014102 [Chlamydomonas sp. UWO 241]